MSFVFTMTLQTPNQPHSRSFKNLNEDVESIPTFCKIDVLSTLNILRIFFSSRMSNHIEKGILVTDIQPSKKKTPVLSICSHKFYFMHLLLRHYQ